MANSMKTMQGCCCEKCVASFTFIKLTGNTWKFTDTSPGTHTRQWTSEDGGSSTLPEWTYTFPTDRMYWVELEVTIPDGTKCFVRHYVGDLLFCNTCDPPLVGETVYVTIPSASPGSLLICENIRSQVPGTWAIDNVSGGNGCTWGVTGYILGTCIRCTNPIGDVGNHVLSGDVSIIEDGWPTVSRIGIRCQLSCGPPTVSTDCNGSADGGGATYIKWIDVGPPNHKTNCVGSHTLEKISESPPPQYIAWPDTISVLIPG